MNHRLIDSVRISHDMMREDLNLFCKIFKDAYKWRHW